MQFCDCGQRGDQLLFNRFGIEDSSVSFKESSKCFPTADQRFFILRMMLCKILCDLIAAGVGGLIQSVEFSEGTVNAFCGGGDDLGSQTIRRDFDRIRRLNLAVLPRFLAEKARTSVPSVLPCFLSANRACPWK